MQYSPSDRGCDVVIFYCHHQWIWWLQGTSSALVFVATPRHLVMLPRRKHLIFRNRPLSSPLVPVGRIGRRHTDRDSWPVSRYTAPRGTGSRIRLSSAVQLTDLP